MFSFKRRNNFAIKITLTALMICTFSINAGSLSALCANVPDVHCHLNLQSQTKQTKTQKNNVLCKQQPLFGRLRKNFNLTTQFTG
ncbi:MAG TPA: hypothetical protein PLV31_06970, partial [Gammaproteobacteria bacterium]|nr:hypothetical protein [Gammaproteobacteria bacterium]